MSKEADVTHHELAFEPSEYRGRVDRVKRKMQEREIDVLLVVDPANMTYLTGFDNWSFYWPQAVIVSLDAADPILVARHTELPGALRTVYMDPKDVVVYPESYIVKPGLHGMRFVAEVIKERFGPNHALGVELDAVCYTPRGHQEVVSALPESRFVDVGRLVNWVRTVKSNPEVAVMRQAGLIANAAMEAVIAAIKPGVRECDAAAELHRALISGTEGFGGGSPIRPSMPTGERTSASHLSWTDQRYEPDSITTIELGGCRHQYHAGLSRSVYLGKPPDQLVRLADVTHNGYYAAIEKVRPGATCADVAAAFLTEIKKHGVEKASRIGYAIGLGYPPSAWVEQTASLAEGDLTVLEPNMTIHIVLGMWRDSWGYIFSETLAVTESGHEVLSTGPRELTVK
jgi:ectoine hydrolase